MPEEENDTMDPADEIPPWPDLIAEFGLLRQQVAEAEPQEPFTVPHVAATEEQLRAAEERLGHPLDPMHRAFLGFGNGWPRFHYTAALLGADDLGHGPVWRQIQENLDAFYSSLPDAATRKANGVFVPPREQIYPISNDEESASIYAVWLGGEQTDGGYPVFWLPWADADPYDNFFDLFRAVYQTYEEELEDATS